MRQWRECTSEGLDCGPVIVDDLQLIAAALGLEGGEGQPDRGARAGRQHAAGVDIAGVVRSPEVGGEDGVAGAKTE